MILKQYYERELSKLHEEAHLFSLEFPDHAAALNLEKNKATDPNVQRLLEGCAYLSARIHQMVDEEADHLPEQLIQRLWPQLSEGFPSVCIAQASPQPGLQKPMNLPKNTALKSPVLGDENTICQFLTTAPLSVYPLSLAEVTLRHHEGETLSLTLEVQGQLTWGMLQADQLSFYIDTPRIKACGLIHLLLSPASTITVEAEGELFRSAALQIKNSALSPDCLLNPQDHSGLMAQQLIFEAFAFPEKLQCLTLCGLDALDLPAQTKSIRLEITHPKCLNPALALRHEDIQLFAVPCINQFEQDCEPILLDHKHHRYALTADHARPTSVSILSVISVEGMPELSRAPVHYSPQHRLRDVTQPSYIVKSQAINPEHTQVYLSFNTSNHEKQSLSIRAKVSNGNTPRRYLRPACLSMAEKHYDSFLAMTNLHQPSAYLPQAMDHLSQNLLRQLSVQVEQIRTASHLKELLGLLNRSENAQVNKRIASILKLRVEVRSCIKRGVFFQVQVFHLDLDETGFTSVSDCFVFGLLMHAFFQESAEIATLIETNLVCHPSEEVFTWLG